MERRLKNAVQGIEMPEDMKIRIIARAQPKPRAWKRPAVALVAMLLCLSLAVPALAANVEAVCDALYALSPSLAQYFRPVQMCCVDNGIEMQVVSAYIHGDTAEICISLRDLEQDRVDASTDLYDSYQINTPFDSEGTCMLSVYDEATQTANFMVRLTHMSGEPVEGDKITFSLREFLSGKVVYNSANIPVDLTDIAEAPKTKRVDSSSSGEDVLVIVPGEADPAFPVEGVGLTGLAFVGGKLHIQVALPGRMENDNHGYFYLMDANRNRIEEEDSYYFKEDGMDYVEHIFGVTPETLAGCTLYANFVTAERITRGDWQVTFPLTQA